VLCQGQHECASAGRCYIRTFGCSAGGGQAAVNDAVVRVGVVNVAVEGERGNRQRGESRPPRTLYTLAIDPALATPRMEPNPVKLHQRQSGDLGGEGLSEGDVWS